MKNNNKFAQWKFIDLFAGLGGFHTAMSNLGMQCVFASEINSELQDLYVINHGIRPAGDIRKVDESRIPKHDVICAGFPCQPFSKAGAKKGTKCPTSGKLIDDVIRIARHHKPQYVLLENVPNILTIDDGKFWKYIEISFSRIGYQLDYREYSPIDFGIPQRRKRIFVVATRNGHKKISWPAANADISKLNLISYIKNIESDSVKPLEIRKINILDTWQEVIHALTEFNHHTILTPEFGATYPLSGFSRLTLVDMKKYKGAWGQSLFDCQSWQEIFERLPHYIKPDTKKPARWLEGSLLHSRELYADNVDQLSHLLPIFAESPRSWQKLQWQGNRENKNIWDHVIQFRASGIRVIKPNTAPSLIAMTPTQIPIIGPERSYMTARAGAALQGLHTLDSLPQTNSAAFKAIGNAVNASIVNRVATSVFV